MTRREFDQNLEGQHLRLRHRNWVYEVTHSSHHGGKYAHTVVAIAPTDTMASTGLTYMVASTPSRWDLLGEA